MSKMSQLHAELIQEAYEKGYDSLSDYLLDRVLENAHEAWLKEKEQVLGELISVYNDIDVPKDCKSYIKHAIEFVKKGEI